jgi:hypothetical protein
VKLDRANAFYYEASGAKYVPRAVLLKLGPYITGALTLSRRSKSSSPQKYRKQKFGRGQQLG